MGGKPLKGTVNPLRGSLSTVVGGYVISILGVSGFKVSYPVLLPIKGC